jgi:ABC-type polysaccharide/polyol phosphate transport system ATPase subunit
MAESESFAELRPLAEAASVAAAADEDGQRSPAVSVRALSKRFRVPNERTQTLKERIMHPLRAAAGQDLVALRDVSFEIGRGEFFSIVGRNGSGKSTLLKCLAGVYRPETGELRVEGRLSPFIELGVGFNQNLNALDNVLLNATLIGLSPREARANFADIIEFAELEDFVDLKLKNYSTGMQMRLGFATAIHVAADVLLVDEVLAVGDAPFKRKCLDTFQRLKREGRTIIFVSHDAGLISQLSDRVLVLDNGVVVTVDRSLPALDEYQRLNTRHEVETRGGGLDVQLGDGSARVIDAWFENESGERVDRFRRGDVTCVKVRAIFRRDLRAPVLGVSLINEPGGLVLTTHSEMHPPGAGDVSAGEERTFVARFENWLGRGVYFATPFVLHSDGRAAAIIERALAIEVASEVLGHHAVIPPSEIEVLAE